MGIFWFVTTCKRRVRSRWKGALCVKGILNQRITCCFIADSRGLFGNLLWVAWAFFGLLRRPLGSRNHLLAWDDFFGREVKKKKKKKKKEEDLGFTSCDCLEYSCDCLEYLERTKLKSIRWCRNSSSVFKRQFHQDSLLGIMRRFSLPILMLPTVHSLNFDCV